MSVECANGHGWTRDLYMAAYYHCAGTETGITSAVTQAGW